VWGNLATTRHWRRALLTLLFPICSSVDAHPRDLLSFAIAFALRGARKLVRGLRQEFTEEERFRVANDVVRRFATAGKRAFDIK